MSGPRDPLEAISPIDGRYAGRTEPLVAYASESALMRARVRVEVEYLIALSEEPALPLEIDAAEREALRSLYESFDLEDARLIKQIETEGYGSYPATNHDVKAVEYYCREHLPETLSAAAWIHFGLTSEDVNNLAYRLLVRGAVETVLLPALESVRTTLVEDARAHRAVPMLARTHGQPATPTTYGKELAVYAARLGRAMARVRRATAGLGGKLAGASGTYAAHAMAAPEIDWPAFARDFVTTLGFEHVPLATQLNPGDDLGRLFDALRGLNTVLLDLDLDMWLYVSDGYLRQRTRAGETGSSTMPHKVNPIDFENSEGNLSKANADLPFLADAMGRSRLQRDLSDSTVKRTIGSTFAHCLLGYTKCRDGLGTVAPDEEAMAADLEANPAVLAEAIQTVLRRHGHDDAYERVKDATRGQSISLSDLRALLSDVDLPDDAHDRLAALTPDGYVGLAARLVEDLE